MLCERVIKIEVSIIISFANKIIRTRYLKKEEMKFWLRRGNQYLQI